MTVSQYKYAEHSRNTKTQISYYRNERCGKCKWHGNIVSEDGKSGWYCDYLSQTGKRRGCPPNDQCTRFVAKKQKKQKQAPAPI